MDYKKLLREILSQEVPHRGRTFTYLEMSEAWREDISPDLACDLNLQLLMQGSYMECKKHPYPSTVKWSTLTSTECPRCNPASKVTNEALLTLIGMKMMPQI